MKADIIKDYVSFKPRVFQLTFESQEEIDSIKYMFGSNITIPSSIYGDSSDKQKLLLNKLMKVIFEGLDKV